MWFVANIAHWEDLAAWGEDVVGALENAGAIDVEELRLRDKEHTTIFDHSNILTSAASVFGELSFAPTGRTVDFGV